MATVKMQLSAKNRKDFEQNFNKLDKETADFLRGSGIAFTTGNFNASGVIFTYDEAEGNTWILTAKHNLLQGEEYKPGKKPLPSKLVGAFTEKITVKYNALNFEKKATQTAFLDKSANNGGNTRIFGGAKQDTWVYDVMMVKSKDGDLLAQARKYAIVKTEEERNALGEVLSFPGLALKRMPQHVYLQVGFGYSASKTSDTDPFVGRFQVRFTSPLANAVAPEVFAYDPETNVEDVNTNVVQLDANNDNSTAPGDSGGPLFLLDTSESNKPRVSLLGVSLGANQSLKKKQIVPNLPILAGTSNYVKQFICEAFPNTGGC